MHVGGLGLLGRVSYTIVEPVYGAFCMAICIKTTCEERGKNDYEFIH